MRVAETSGKTVDEAVGRALAQLGLRREQVDVDVIREGSKGFLGIGSEDAIVRVTAKDSGPVGVTRPPSKVTVYVPGATPSKQCGSLWPSVT